MWQCSGVNLGSALLVILGFTPCSVVRSLLVVFGGPYPQLSGIKLRLPLCKESALYTMFFLSPKIDYFL